MKKFLGFLTYLFFLSFTLCLLLSITGSAFNYCAGKIAISCFFCCGIPMIMFTSITFKLWKNYDILHKILRLTSLTFAFIFSMVLIYYTFITIISGGQYELLSLHFLGFWIPIVYMGLFGFEIFGEDF